MSDPDSDILDASARSSITGAPSFSLRNRLERAIFGVTWTLLCRWTPPPLHLWRCFILKLFGAKVGRGVRVYGSTKIWYPPHLTLSDYALLGPNVNVYCQGPIALRPYAIVSQYTHLVAGTHDVDDPNFQLYVRPIEVGENAWVAANAFVGPGVTVGEGAVLGACGVAFKDLEPWTIYAGNPAKRLKRRKHFSRQ